MKYGKPISALLTITNLLAPAVLHRPLSFPPLIEFSRFEFSYH